MKNNQKWMAWVVCFALLFGCFANGGAAKGAEGEVDRSTMTFKDESADRISVDTSCAASGKAAILEMKAEKLDNGAAAVKGDEIELVATIATTGCAVQGNVTWESTNTELVKIMEGTLRIEKIPVEKLPAAEGWEEAYKASVMVKAVNAGKASIQASFSTNTGIKADKAMQIEVKEKEVTGIKVESDPDKMEYIEGQRLNLKGLKVKLIYNNNETTELSYGDDTQFSEELSVSMEDGQELTNKDHNKKITITYKNITAETTNVLKVTKKEATGITIKSQPTKLEYTEGDYLNLDGLEVTVTYNNGHAEDIGYSDFEYYEITTDLQAGVQLTLDKDGYEITLYMNKSYVKLNKLQVSPKRYSIKYILGEGGSISSDAPTTYTTNANVTIPEPERSGYAFIGWLLDGSGDKFSSISQSKGDLTLRAQWSKVDLELLADKSKVAVDSAKKIVLTVSGTDGYKGKFIWKKDGKKIRESTECSITVEIQKAEKGTYTCEFVNSRGTVITDASVSVLSYVKEHKIVLGKSIKFSDIFGDNKDSVKIGALKKKDKKYISVSKKGTIKVKKYFKGSKKVTLTIGGEKCELSVSVKLPKPTIKVKKGKRKRYIEGVYRNFKVTYKNIKGATKIVAYVSKSKSIKTFKKAPKSINKKKGAKINMKKGSYRYLLIYAYYGKGKSPVSNIVKLKG